MTHAFPTRRSSDLNSQEAADRELEPFRSRIINDACIHVRPPANPRASGIQLKRRMISTKRSQDLASYFVGDVATHNKSPDRLFSAEPCQRESGAGNMPQDNVLRARVSSGVP